MKGWKRRPAPQIKRPPAEPAPAPKPPGVALADLDWSHCRYQLPSGRYCGEKIANPFRSSWCARHAKKVFGG